MIDVQAHVIVRELLREAAPAEDWRADVRRENGAQVVEFGGKAIRSAVGEFVDVSVILDQLASEEVVLSPWVPLLFDDVERCRLQNTGIERLASDRVTVLGSVPLTQPGDTAKLTVTLKKGSFPYLCTVPGHAAAGMKGTFTVG